MSLGWDEGGEWGEGRVEDEDTVKMGTTTTPNDAASSEPAITLPSTRMGNVIRLSRLDPRL